MNSHLITCLLTLASCLPARALEPRPHLSRRPPPIAALFHVIDKDQDQILSAEEIKSASEAIAKLDLNDDGKITLDESHPPPQKLNEAASPHSAPHEKPPAPPVINAMDTDRDGSLSADELNGAPTSLKTLDKNSDGLLSPEELRPQNPRPHTVGIRHEDTE